MTSLDIAPPQRRWGALAAPGLAGALFAALVAIAAAPALLWPIPRGNDIVNHWARLTLYRLAPDDPIAGLYHVHFGVIPNLGIDALYLVLAPILSAQDTARLALILAIALPALGANAIHRALFKIPSPTIWLAPFLSYNIATTVGLLNFALGVGLAFFGVAYLLSRGGRIGVKEIAALNLIGAALFFCHLIAWAVFALLVGLILAAVWPPRPVTIARRAGLALASQALPLLLVALREPAPSTYSMFDRSAVGLFQAPIASMTQFDTYATVFLIAGVALALVRGIRVAPQVALALAGFALVALIAPGSHGAATLIDARLKVYLWYFALAATALKSDEAVRAPIALLAVALTAARLVSVAPAWIAFQERAETVRAALGALPPGSRALVVAPSGCRDPDLPWTFVMTTFAVIDRRAYVNTLFAQSGIQPVAPADAALDGGPTLPMDARWLDEAGQAALPAGLRDAAWAGPFRDWRSHFTHVIDAHGACASTVKAPSLTRLGGGGGLDVYRID